MRPFGYTWRTFGRELTLIALAIAFCVPVYILAALSLKTTPQTFIEPLAIPTGAELENYSRAWREGARRASAAPHSAVSSSRWRA